MKTRTGERVSLKLLMIWKTNVNQTQIEIEQSLSKTLTYLLNLWTRIPAKQIPWNKINYNYRTSNKYYVFTDVEIINNTL